MFSFCAYLSDPDLPAGQQEVLDVPPALGRVQLGLEEQRGTDRLLEPFQVGSNSLNECFGSYDCGRGDVDAGDGARPHVVGDVAQHHAVLQRGR